MIELLSFLLAVLILVTVHEYGHFIVARWCGVRVLRFSIGFGKPFLRYVDAQGTEFCLAPIPLGGYVKFLDTREMDSAEALAGLTEHDRATAFDLQNVCKRIAIVAAGPLINFLLAFVLLSALSYGEKTIVLPVVGDMSEDSVVYSSGMRKGDQIVQINHKAVKTWSDVYLFLLQEAMTESAVQVKFMDAQGMQVEGTLSLDSSMVGEQFSWQRYGLVPWQPKIPPVVGKVIEQNGVDNAMLMEKDYIVSIDQKSIESWQALVNEIKQKPNQNVSLSVLREGDIQSLEVTLGSRIVEGQVVGFLGVQVALPSPELWSRVHKKVENTTIDALGEGWQHTVKMIRLIVGSVVGMISGNLGLNHLGGPITIAQKASESVQMGVATFMMFLAFLSVSLGVLNLLPIPLLDGGHIALYVWEAISGKVPSEQLQLVFQRIGFGIVITLTLVALLNDFLRF